jgi:hypothetical protein
VREMNVRDKVSIHCQGEDETRRGDGSSFFNKSKSKNA